MIFKNQLKNCTGFSLMELMISVGLLGAVTIGVTQLTKNSTEQSQKYSEKLEFKKLTNLISQEFSKSEVCSAQFRNQEIEENYTELKSGARVLLKVGEPVLGSRFQVEKIQTIKMDKTKFLLKMTYKNLRPSPGARNEYVENLPISAELNDTKIVSCYENIAQINYDGVCAGEGVIVNPNDSCSIKGLETFPETCATGSSFSEIVFDVASLRYKIICKEPLQKTGGCPNDQIKQYSPDGSITCLDLVANHIDSTPATINAGNNCGVIADGNKLKFSCEAGSPPSDPLDPICPTPPACGSPKKMWPACSVGDCPVCAKKDPCGGLPGGVSGGSSGGWSACFIAGTKIKMSSGEEKNIEDVSLGDQLLDGDNQIVTVQKLLPREYFGEIYSINGSRYFFTPNHPFKTLEGWKSIRPDLTKIESPELRTTKLRLGDVLVKSTGLELVVALDYIQTNEMVYNFSLDGSHEYIADEYVVHNKMACPTTTCGGPVYTCGTQEMPFGYSQQYCPVYQCTPCF